MFYFQNNYIQPSRSISGSGSSSDDDSCPNRSVTLRDLYSLRQVLSDTSNGTVFSGRRRRDGRPVAIKRIMRNKVKRWGIVRDRQVKILLRHGYVMVTSWLRHGYVMITTWLRNNFNSLQIT